ncbi:unnamed protein product, partial [Meganyctiphanes norvegica]
MFFDVMKGVKLRSQFSAVSIPVHVLYLLEYAGSNNCCVKISSHSYMVKATFGKSNLKFIDAHRLFIFDMRNRKTIESSVGNFSKAAANETGPLKWKNVIVYRTRSARCSVLTRFRRPLGRRCFKIYQTRTVRGVLFQRNGQRSLFSMDTVVALQAMASFEASQDQGPVDMQVALQAEALNPHTFIINEDNKLLQQMVVLPTIPTKVSLDMAGTGCALLQAVLRYNVPEPDPSEAFNLTISTKTEPDRKCNTKRIKTCASYLLPDGKSNMAVIEVKLISGYIPEKSDLKQLVGYGSGLIKRYEVDGNLVTFYIDEFSSEDICVDFRVIREIDVEDAKPGTVKVYDYYQTEFSVSKSYTLPPNDECLSIMDPQPIDELIIGIEEELFMTTTIPPGSENGAIADLVDALDSLDYP